jgi:hypothetical protein
MLNLWIQGKLVQTSTLSNIIVTIDVFLKTGEAVKQLRAGNFVSIEIEEAE